MSDITPEDIRGETAAGREAYNQRRRYLRDEGIAFLEDLYDDDLAAAYTNEAAAGEYYSTAQYWEDLAAKAARNAAQEREWTRQDERIHAQFGPHA